MAERRVPAVAVRVEEHRVRQRGRGVADLVLEEPGHPSPGEVGLTVAGRPGDL